MEENQLKLEFKELIEALSSEISCNVLTEDMNKVKVDHIENLKRYEEISNKLFMAYENLKSTEAGLLEVKHELENTDLNVNKSSKRIEEAVVLINHWNKTIVEEIILGYEMALDTKLQLIDKTILSATEKITDWGHRNFINFKNEYYRQISNSLENLHLDEINDKLQFLENSKAEISKINSAISNQNNLILKNQEEISEVKKDIKEILNILKASTN